MSGMIGTNIRVLRKRNKQSQEFLAERLGVSRQTIAKWESGESLPDLYRCRVLADHFQVSLDQLSGDLTEAEANRMAPRGKHFFGVAQVGQDGQVNVPKKALERFGIREGDQLVVLGDDSSMGIALLKRDTLLDFAEMIRNAEPEGGE